MRQVHRCPTLGTRQQGGKRVIGQHIAIHHDKRRVAQQRQSAGNAAGGFQCGGFGGIVQLHAPRRTLAQGGFKRRAKVGVVDHNVGQPCRRQVA